MTEERLEFQEGKWGPRFHAAATDAIRYWEPRRIIYNAVLAAIVLGYLAWYWPHSRNVVTFDGVLVLFLVAVVANICYCAAYLGDVFAQASGFRDSWRKRRWLLLLIGTAVAATITRFFAINFFH